MAQAVANIVASVDVNIIITQSMVNTTTKIEVNSANISSIEGVTIFKIKYLFL